MYQTLVDVSTAIGHVGHPDWVFIDCRFDLSDTAAGRRQYEDSHIAGAVYAHLDDDLSSAPVTDYGRHPLPSPADLTKMFSRLGIDGNKQVVVYDASQGMIASRLWWMLQYMGHEAAAVLDGGWQAWQAMNGPTKSGLEHNETTLFVGEPRRDLLVTVDHVLDAPLLIDSREAARYRGEEELLDPQAGHIPGAKNFFFGENVDEEGHFLSAEDLRTQMLNLIGENSVEEVTFYCGSGVSACVNLLAMAHAGVGFARLYVGSWSEWSRDSDRPIATDV